MNYSPERRDVPADERKPSRVILFHKPWGVLSQFRTEAGHPGLEGFSLPPDVYAAGRLDRDSEGLLILTDDGVLQARITQPRSKWPKTYAVQLEGAEDPEAWKRLECGVTLKDGPTLPTVVRALKKADFAERDPPIRQRRSIPTHWIEITLREGRNRQVRRMTAHVGLPTLRLIRLSIGPCALGTLPPGHWRELAPDEAAALKRWRPRPA